MKLIFFIILPLLFTSAISTKQKAIDWKNLEAGLDYASIDALIKSIHADSKIDILRINPDYFSFELQCMEQKKTGNKKIDQICKENKFNCSSECRHV
jgi:hypothetical protein